MRLPVKLVVWYGMVWEMVLSAMLGTCPGLVKEIALKGIKWVLPVKKKKTNKKNGVLTEARFWEML